MNTPALSPTEVTQLIVRFNDALNTHDVDAMMRFLTPDSVFENTSPFPDGMRYEGHAAVRAFWEQFFRDGLDQHIEVEDIFACGDHCTMRWVYSWRGAAGAPGHIRGADVYTVRAGLIAEKLSYVKG
jgi:ketosteroid isomerase-like protein